MKEVRLAQIAGRLLFKVGAADAQTAMNPKVNKWWELVKCVLRGRGECNYAISWINIEQA